ncbi:hypothetical protein MTO96_052099 [Rhipicephalus appendiculatus]
MDNDNVVSIGKELGLKDAELRAWVEQERVRLRDERAEERNALKEQLALKQQARKVCDTSDVVLASAPITHLSGLLWGPICVLSGAKCIFTPPLVGLQDLVPIIKEYRVTRALFFPSQLRALCEEMQRSGERLDTIRAVAVAGAALTQAMYDAAFKAFGGLKRLVNVYTLTEAGGTLCTPSTDTDTDLGFPSAMNELKVVDITSRRTLGPREVGEICFRSPAVMRGYYKRPKDTAEFFEGDGWCKTGDAGYYDESGRFHFVQRLKELIKCMDNQVVPGELEGLLLQEFATNISEVVVVGLDHPRAWTSTGGCRSYSRKRHSLPAT